MNSGEPKSGASILPSPLVQSDIIFSEPKQERKEENLDLVVEKKWFRMVKRVEDLILGTIALIIALPIIFLIAILIKITSPGSIFFYQIRRGRKKKPFLIYKFRTMTVTDLKGREDQILDNDPRVTSFGAFLRKTSLDELPQLLNVLKGEMSLVGPRPHAIFHDEEFKEIVPNYEERFRVKPGMTGWAQVNGYRGPIRSLEELQKRVEYDLEYIQKWSLWLDLKILWLTLWRGFGHPPRYKF